MSCLPTGVFQLPLTALLVAGITASIARATIWEASAEAGNLQSILDLAANRDTVLVLPGIHTGNFRVLDKGLTVASGHLFSGDTSMIAATILDGNSSGSVLHIRSFGLNRTVLHGLTLRNGLGSFGGFSYSELGGGIRLDENTNVDLEYLQLHHNRAPRAGAALTGFGSFGRVNLRHLELWDNETTASPAGDPAIRLAECRSVTLEDIRFRGGPHNGTLLSVAQVDSLVARDLEFDGIRFPTGTLAHLWGDDTVVERVTVSDCHTTTGDFLTLQGSDRLVAHDIVISGNSNDGPQHQDNDPRFLGLYSYGTGDIRRIRFLDNRAPHGDHMLHVTGDEETLIQDLDVIGNTLGLADTLYQDPAWSLGKIAYLSASTIEDVRVLDNLRIIPRLQIQGNWSGMMDHGGLLEVSSADTHDQVVLRRLECSHNHLVDLDATNINENANIGQALYLQGYNADLLLEDAVFMNNTQNRPALPPSPYCNECPESLVEIYGENVTVANTLLLDNTSGYMKVRGSPALVRNTQQVNPGLYGVSVWGGEVELDNLLVQGVNQPTNIPVHRFTSALQTSSMESAVVRNCTISECTTRSLLSFSVYEEPVSAQVRNCSLVGNQFSRLEHEYVSEGNVIGEPADFSYCLLPMTMEGEGNLVAGDHGMRGVKLLRAFSPDSPCIDAGDPATGMDDPEDPLRPGFPALPSLGTRRNDIGHLGGPYAGLLPCIGALPAPPNLRIESLPGRVRLSWDAVHDSSDDCPAPAAGYAVRVADTPQGPWTLLAETSALEITVPRTLGHPLQFFQVFSLAEETP